MVNKNIIDPFFITAFVVIIIDQVTKFFASKITAPIQVIGTFLELDLVHNTGAGFGILQGWRWPLILIALIIIGVIIWQSRRYKDDLMTYIFLGLVLGGAIGNLIDRIYVGYVIDFISFSFWPAFNAADSAITIGVIGLILAGRPWKR